MNGSSPLPDGNPFATRCVRPGAIDYLFPPECGAEQLVRRLGENRWWGEIIGPHGSGKSTLLETLVPHLRRAGRRVERFTLHQGQRRLQIEPAAARGWNADTQIIVDGFEQLSWWGRRRMKGLGVRIGCGLLVTAHRSVRLPPLYRTDVTLETAQAVVARVLPPGESPVTREDVAQLFALHGSDLRELMFGLYDLVEQRRQ